MPSKVVADISMSVDGFVTGPGPGLEHGLGVGGDAHALHEWAFSDNEVDREVLDAMVAATGVVVMGRRTFDIVDAPGGWNAEMGYGGARDQSNGPPVLVVTHSPPAAVRLAETFSFELGGLEAAIANAQSIADDRDIVIMGGGEVVSQALDLGLVDELRLHLAPVLLSAGTPLFTGVRSRSQALRQIEARITPHATHLTYRL